ncbi:MAG: hypothetical protein U0835_16450 [Isosphaeraceae bacterium]
MKREAHHDPGLVAKRRRLRTWRWLSTATTGKFGLLMMALIALMASTPLIIEGRTSNSFLVIFTGAVLVASLHAARPGRGPVGIGLGLAVADFLMGRLTAAYGSHTLIFVQLSMWLATLVFVTATILESIFESDEVTVETLQAALCVYLLMGVLGGFGYALLDLSLPGSFELAHGPAVDWSDAGSRSKEFVRLFVFSFSTLSGTSYTEIAPATGFASNMSSLQAMAGQIYLAVVVARLVGVETATSPREEK